MKIFILIFISLNLFANLGFANLDFINLDVTIDAPYAILMNAKNKRVIFEKNAHVKTFPASLTKVATAIYALEKGFDLSKKIRVSKDSIITIEPQKKHISYKYPAYYLETDGSGFDLKENEVILSKTLMYALLIRSGNDCANVIAKNVSGSIENFMDEMNLFLRGIGCKNTHFDNPHGLHYPSHVSTAYDLAILTKRALDNPIFRKIVGTKTYLSEKTNMHEKRKILQYNQLLNRDKKFYYPYAFGVKTGYHSKAKYAFIAAAKKDRTLIAVLLQEKNSEKRFEDAIKLFEKAFSEKKEEVVYFRKNELFKFNIQGGNDILNAYLKNDLKYEYYPSEKQKVFAYIYWKNLSLPIKRNSLVGVLCLKTSDGEIFFQNLYAKNEVKKDLFCRLFDFFKNILKIF